MPYCPAPLQPPPPPSPFPSHPRLCVALRSDVGERSPRLYIQIIRHRNVPFRFVRTVCFCFCILFFLFCSVFFSGGVAEARRSAVSDSSCSGFIPKKNGFLLPISSCRGLSVAPAPGAGRALAEPWQSPGRALAEQRAERRAGRRAALGAGVPTTALVLNSASCALVPYKV